MSSTGSFDLSGTVVSADTAAVAAGTAAAVVVVAERINVSNFIKVYFLVLVRSCTVLSVTMMYITKLKTRATTKGD